MPVIKFPSEWVKLGSNTQKGDQLKFLNSGEFDEDKGSWNFKVAILRNGELVEPEKSFTLNKTNFEIIRTAYGDNSDNWVNKVVIVGVVKVRNPQTGALVDGIMLEIPSQEAAPAA